MSNVREFVTDNLTQQGLGQYVRQAEPIITALEGRDADIADQIITAAAEEGHPYPDRLRALLTEVGLVTDQPQAAAQGGDIAAALARIENTLSGLTQFARNNGYRG